MTTLRQVYNPRKVNPTSAIAHCRGRRHRSGSSATISEHLASRTRDTSYISLTDRQYRNNPLRYSIEF